MASFLLTSRRSQVRVLHCPPSFLIQFMQRLPCFFLSLAVKFDLYSTSVTCPVSLDGIKIQSMRLNAKCVIAALIVCGASYLASAQREVRESENSGAIQRVSDDTRRADQTPAGSRTLTSDDGLAVIAAALDARIHLARKPDCSHLVHAIYDLAGFPYSYAKSSDLFAGIDEFQRVTHPQPGDLAVWRGHVGIVVNPTDHVFFSALRSGLGIDTYDAPYWKERGQVRFYRYLKRDPRPAAAKATTKARDHFLSTHTK
jgi:hypothetical protein